MGRNYICMPPAAEQEDILERVELFYDPDENVMIDACGRAIFDVFNYITPNELFLFKTSQHNMVLSTKDYRIELFYGSYGD